MASIAGALARIKQDLGAYLGEQQVIAACHAAGHVWRERKLGPVLTLHLFVLQLLHCNTAMGRRCPHGLKPVARGGEGRSRS